eukprot:m.205546 g.205546  ORF g.205546 m.205546 type:complete len:414 (-) comp22994_c0_seq1:101-1342(-)
MGKHGKRKHHHRPKDLVDEVLCGASADDVTRWVNAGRAKVDAVEDDSGRTALMVAAAQAKPKVAEALVSLGASLLAADHLGHTALHHLTHKHTRLPKRIKTLLVLLGAPRARDAVCARNRAGNPPLIGLYGLARVARNAAASTGEHARAEEAEAILNDYDPVGSGGSLPSKEKTEEAAWRHKLGEAFADDVTESGGRFYGHVDPVLEDTSVDDPLGSVHVEDDLDMGDGPPTPMGRKRKRVPMTTDPGAPGDAARNDEVPSWMRDRARLEEEMRAYEQAQREASARLIAEEKAKTDALRHRKHAVSYQTRAASFFATDNDAQGGGSGGVSLADVPWPGATAADVRAVVLAGETDKSISRKLLKAELMRWHPDRWSGSAMLDRVREDDRPAVLTKVQETSQLLNQLLGELSGPS